MTGAVRACREIASGLLAVEERGLCAALGDRVHERQLQAPGIRIVFENRSAGTHRHPYRIAQEALDGAVQHSDLTHIRVVCRATAKRVSLLIEDDGQQASDALGDRPGLDLRTLRDRAAAVDGWLVIGPAR